MNIVNVGYDSTNYYLLQATEGKLLVDCGWPGTLPKLKAELKRKSVAFGEIRYLLVTHFHPDHAGLTQELKDAGVQHLLFAPQVDFISQLTDFFKGKNFPYVQIRVDGQPALKLEDSRATLLRIGIAGEVIHTPGHSDDSISLILDNGFAFTGDLPPRFMVPEEDVMTRVSWDKIHQYKVNRILPSHGA